MVEELSRLDALLARVRAGRTGDALERVTVGWRRLAAATGRAVDPVGHAAGRSVSALRPGRPPILYRDRLITLDEQGVVVSRYYLPVGRKRIDYADVSSIRELPMTGLRSYRVHGFSFPRYWLHRDSARGERSVGLVLDTGGWLRPVLTPVDVNAVLATLHERVPAVAGG